MSTKSAKSNGATTAAAAAPVAKSAAAKSSSSSGVWLSPMSVAALVVLLAVLIQVVTVPSVTGPPSSRKPYSSFQQFYPFYASEHSDTSQSHCRRSRRSARQLRSVLDSRLGISPLSAASTVSLCPPANRQLHFAGTTIVALLFLLNPRSIPSILLGACVGYLVCPALIGLAHGFVEFAVVIGVFLATHKLSTGKVSGAHTRTARGGGQRFDWATGSARVSPPAISLSLCALRFVSRSVWPW